MFQIPHYYHALSLRLSEVLDDIGVNEASTMKFRQATLLKETMETVTQSPEKSEFKFGSLSEGTTTAGLNSDTDTLICDYKMIVIQDYTEWQPSLHNLLTIKDENVFPGYCQLQVIRPDSPLPLTDVVNRHFIKASSDRVLLQNTCLKSSKKTDGPSWVGQGGPGLRSSDFVPAILCKSWPHEARKWLHRRRVSLWPTSEMTRFAEKSGFFVVPVGSKVSPNEVLEWRISTSLAERCLMFSLNITQIRCYILLKMILKTYLNSQGESHISSYMCKTVLLYCIENTQQSVWKEINLISCLSVCLQRLSICVLCRNCPHFIIPGNNLMAGKFLGPIRSELQNSLCQIMESNGSALFGMKIDELGIRLMISLGTSHHPVQALVATNYEILLSISSDNIRTLADRISFIHRVVLDESLNDRSEVIQQRLIQYLQKYITVYSVGNMLEQTASILLAPLICSTIGTIKASLNILGNKGLSSLALDWLHAGLNSDVSSGRLKLASVLYCMGDLVRTEVILSEILRQYRMQSVEPVCGCYNFQKNLFKIKSAEVTYYKNIVQCIRENISFCVKFTPAEIYCIPPELQYEMFRSTQDDLLYRNVHDDYWMDWAVVDSLPYLYFLQYKIFSQLQRYADQQLALNYLIFTIIAECNIGHRETALNLLGLCMEQENRIQDALYVYERSLNIRERNNIARMHVCKLLATVVNQNML